MNRPTFAEGVAVAVAASVAGAAVFSALALTFAGDTVLRALIAGLSLAYVLYLLRRSQERVGRTTVIGMWLIATAGVWLASPSPGLYVAAHIGMIWLVRSLYHHASILSALADLALNGLAAAAAVWAGSATGSLLLALWCFFLVQALFVAIPARWRRRSADQTALSRVDDPFEHAHRVAEAALQRCASQR